MSTCSETRFTSWRRILLGTVAAAGMLPALVPQTTFAQAVTGAPGAGSDAAINYANAQPMPLPQSSKAPASLLDVLLARQRTDLGKPGVSPGRNGNGQLQQIQLAPAQMLGDSGIGSQEYGTSNHVFTTSRVNAQGNQTSKFYPYRAAGKLFFNIGASTFVCSASLVKRGVVVTAAHCLADFGGSFYTNWRFVPAYNNGAAPFGTWTAANAFVMTSYLNGTDSCAVSGVVCQNDVGVIVLRPQSGAYAGARTGWLGYGWNGFGFNPSNLALISQLGYPVALDGGKLMERTDSQAYVDGSLSNNSVIGSLQTGGSSGGPWPVNLGLAPALNGTSFGAEATHNVVVGVTSWGYVSTAIKEQGASPFTSGNIVPLVNAACAFAPAACT